MTLSRRFLPVSIALAGLFGGCSNSTGALDTSTEVKTSGGTYTVTYTPNSNPIPVNTVFTLTVTVLNGAGTQKVTGATVSVNATMPDMNMGMPSPAVVTQNADGTFTASNMFFPMDGHWVLDVGVTDAGATQQADFNIVVGTDN